MSYSEDEIRDAALVQLNATKNGTLTTTELIALLTKTLNPTGHDADILDGRSDTYFSQKVRNIVSHRDQNTGIQSRGLAIYDADLESWTITQAGREYVADL